MQYIILNHHLCIFRRTSPAQEVFNDVLVERLHVYYPREHVRSLWLSLNVRWVLSLASGTIRVRSSRICCKCEICQAENPCVRESFPPSIVAEVGVWSKITTQQGRERVYCRALRVPRSPEEPCVLRIDAAASRQNPVVKKE